jgi:hypothetical protein
VNRHIVCPQRGSNLGSSDSGYESVSASWRESGRRSLVRISARTSVILLWLYSVVWVRSRNYALKWVTTTAIYMCFDLNALSTATDAMRHMQPGKRHWINSKLAQVFLDYLSEFPQQGARDACWLSLVTRVLGTGSQIGAQPSALVACSAQFMWPANRGKQKEFSNAGSRTQIHWKIFSAVNLLSTFNTHGPHRLIRLPIYFPSKFCNCLSWVQATCPVNHSLYIYNVTELDNS